MARSDSAIRQALRTRLRTVANLPTVAPVNVATDQSVKLPYVRDEVLFGAELLETRPADGGWVRGVVLYQVDLYYPLGEGPVNADAMARAICLAFPFGLTLLDSPPDRLVVPATGGARRFGGFPEDGRYRVPLTITCEHWTTNSLT